MLWFISNSSSRNTNDCVPDAGHRGSQVQMTAVLAGRWVGTMDWTALRGAFRPVAFPQSGLYIPGYSDSRNPPVELPAGAQG